MIPLDEIRLDVVGNKITRWMDWIRMKYVMEVDDGGQFYAGIPRSTSMLSISESNSTLDP